MGKITVSFQSQSNWLLRSLTLIFLVTFWIKMDSKWPSTT